MKREGKEERSIKAGRFWGGVEGGGREEKKKNKKKKFHNSVA